jgi:hypothetical protein
LVAFTVPAQSIDEYQVKATFLCNFVKFAEWPPQTFTPLRTRSGFACFGQDPSAHALVDAVTDKTVLGRAFVFTGLTNTSEATECQMLSVSSSERKHLRSIFARLRARGVLSVGEKDGFAIQGGIVNFKLEDGRVRLIINFPAAEQAKLRISSKVLSLAQIAKSAEQK